MNATMPIEQDNDTQKGGRADTAGHARGWQDQLKEIRPLVPKSTGVEFIAPPEKETPISPTNDGVSKIRTEEAQELQHVSREHIQFPAPDTKTARDFDTSGARDALRADMKETKIDVLPTVVDADNLPVSSEDTRAFNAVMNEGFLDESKSDATEEKPTNFTDGVRQKLAATEKALHERAADGDQEKLKKFEAALADLSQRIEDTINAGGPALEQNLQKLSDEVATVGTPEWEKRFVGSDDNAQPRTPEKENTVDALDGHLLNDAIEAIKKKLNTAAVTVEMAFRNNAFDEKRMEKFHSVALDIAERIQKVIDERSSYSTEHTLKRLEELSAEIPAIGKEEATPPPIKEAMPTEGQPNTNHQQTQTITQKRLDNLESLKPMGEIENADLIKYHSGQRQTQEENQKPQESVAEAEDVSVPEETNEDVAKETIPEKKTEIDAEIEAQFQKDFALAEEDLKNITAEVGEGAEKKTVRFSDLTSGQQILLLANLKDFALDNAKEQALKRFTKKEKEKEKQRNAGFIIKAWLSFTKTYRRSADMAQMEKDILAKPEMDKETYTEVLREMLGQAHDAPEAEWKEGKLQVNFVFEKDFDGFPAGKEMVKNFNDAAIQFSNIPAEWVYSEKEDEKKQYDEARASYILARGGLLNLKAEGGKEDQALAYTASLDKKVQFNQLFNANPDVEKTFAAAKDQNAFWEGTKALLTEKGKLMVAGRALRTLGMVGGTALAIGSGFGAPLAAALAGGFAGGALSGGIIGRYMAGKRAGQELEDKKNLAEMGTTDQSNEKEFRAAHKEKEGIEMGIGLADKLSYAVSRVLGAKTAEEKEKLLAILADRMRYTEKKISMGVVNFGEGADGFKNRYELLSALAAARTLHQMNEPKTNEKIEKKIDEMLGTQKERIETAEEKLKSEKMRQGMKYGILLGGTFGTLLSSISYAHVHGENAAGAEAGVAAATTLAKPSLADEVLAKMNPGKILPNEESAVQLERIPDVGPLPKEVLPASTADIAPGTQSGVELLSPRKISIENSFEELGKTYTVKTGDNVWNIIKAKLGGNENFAKLPSREQNFIIDSIKDKIVKMSPKELQEIGIKGDPNRVYPGDELKLGKVFHSSDDLIKIFNRAADSSPVTEQHAIVPPATEPTPVISPSAEEPVILAQNENITADVAPPLQPENVASDIHHEIFAPTGGRSEVFLTRAEDIPSYADYKSMVYDEIHLRHPNIERSLYDMKMKDFLAGNPNGLEDLKRVFHIQGVQTPKILPQETLNGSVLDWWTRQVVQDDFNRHGGSIASESLASTDENEISRHLSESAVRTRVNVYRSETENPNMAAHSAVGAQTNTADVSAVTAKIHKIFDAGTRSS